MFGRKQQPADKPRQQLEQVVGKLSTQQTAKLLIHALKKKEKHRRRL